MKRTDVAFYDEIYADDKKREQYDRKEPPWLPLWQRAAARVTREDHVADLGCGLGHFAALLAERGHPSDRYLGVDFSPEAVRRASAKVPGFSFRVGELPAAASEAGREIGAGVAVLLEVLEHIEADVESIAALQPGTRVLASVPSGPATYVGHLRAYPTQDHVRLRYQSVLEITELAAAAPWHWYFEGVRRD